METDLDQSFPECVLQNTRPQDLTPNALKQSNKTGAVAKLIWETKLTRFPNAEFFRAFNALTCALSAQVVGV